MLKLALSRECRARGRLQHKPIAAAESRLRERRRGDAKTDSPQSNYNGRLQHKPIGSGYGREQARMLKKPAIRSRECHVRGRLQHKPIAVAESRLRERRRGDAKTLFSASNYNGSAARAREAAARGRAGADAKTGPLQSDHGSARRARAACAGDCSTNS